MTSPLDLAARKSALRLEMKARRAQMNEAARARASWLACNRISSFLETRKERTIGIYLARPQEICLDSLIGELLRDGYEIAAPRVDVERAEMTFWRLECLEKVEIGPWNVREPIPTHKVSDIGLILAPGLAFDRQGHRLGTGGGWYDRTLQEAQTVVGVCFDCQIMSHIPTESYDCDVHFLASENRWLETKTSA